MSMTGRQLADIFLNSTSQVSDKISKYEFAEKMNEISRRVGDDLDTVTVERFARELNAGDNMVSYNKLISTF